MTKLVVQYKEEQFNWLKTIQDTAGIKVTRKDSDVIISGNEENIEFLKYLTRERLKKIKHLEKCLEQ